MTLSALALTELSRFAGLAAAFGCLQAGLGALALRQFTRRARFPAERDAWPAVSVLKPLHGDEPLLEEALTSFCQQDYAQLQIVFGVQNPADPAIAIVRRLQARFPHLALDLVVDSRPHGANRKIANLINMMTAVRHDVLVISDSDIHARPDYLRQVVHTLQSPGVGLASTLYYGHPATTTWLRRLASGQINHNFLPGNLLARWLGRQDCLGATMALTRDTLARIGGFGAISDHIADDAMLGRLVRETGQSVALAGAVTATTISETRLGDVFAHELRWGRTVRTQEPLGYVLSSLQLPLFWATLAVALAPSQPAAWGLFAAVWSLRALLGRTIDHLLGIGRTVPFWMLPFRDWMSLAVMIGSFTGRKVDWRGHSLHIASHKLDTPGMNDLPGLIRLRSEGRLP